MNLQTLRNRVYIHTRDFRRERFDPLLIDRLLTEAQEEFNAQTRLFRTSADLTTSFGVADLIANTESGQISQIQITNAGSGYVSAPTPTFSSGVSSVVITGAGSGYSSAPAVTFGAPNVTGGVTATGTATISGGAVTGITITNPGSGYTSAPTITFGSGAAAATAYIGSGAAATFILSNGRVSQVVLTNPGAGYIAPALTLTAAPSGGDTAAASVLVATQDTPSIQGDILRVEDMSATPPVALVRTSEEALDVLVGPTWRSNNVGSPQFYIRGKGGRQYAGSTDAIPADTYSGYDALSIYPMVDARNIRVWYVKRPVDLIGDYDTPSIPEHYHMALVWHATATLLAESASEGDAAKSQFAQAKYQEFVRRGIEEADQSLRWR